MSDTKTRPWGVAAKQTGSWWAGEDNWSPDPANAAKYPTKAEARQAFTDAHGGKFPTSRFTTDQLPEAPAAPGGVTGKTPGMTDRVAAIIAKNGAKAEETAGAEVAVPEDTVPALSDAEALDGRIRAQAAAVDTEWGTPVDLLDEAKAKAIHEELGFRGWPEYVADAVSANMPNIARDVEKRRDAVALMTGAGMSQRAIADAIGVNHATISRDQAATEPVSHDATPAPVDAEVIEYPWILQRESDAMYWGGTGRDDWGFGAAEAAAYSSAKQVKLAWTKYTGVQRIPKDHCVIQLSEDDLYGEPLPEIQPDVAETITVTGRDGKQQTRVKTDPKPEPPQPDPAPAAPPNATFANVMNRLTTLIEAAEQVADMISDLDFGEGTAQYKGEIYDGSQQYDTVEELADQLAQITADALDTVRSAR